MPQFLNYLPTSSNAAHIGLNKTVFQPLSEISRETRHHDSRHIGRLSGISLCSGSQPSASATSRANSNGSKGLAITPFTPRPRSLRMSAACTLAVRNRTGISRVRGLAASSCNVAGPSISGIMTSSRMASGRSAAANRIPSLPDRAVRTVQSLNVFRCILTGSSQRVTRRSLQGKRKEEAATLAKRAFHPDPASMLRHDSPADGQPQTGTAFFSRVRGIHLLKALKNAGEFGSGNTSSMVRDLEYNLCLAARRGQAHLAASD